MILTGSGDILGGGGGGGRRPNLMPTEITGMDYELTAVLFLILKEIENIQ